ncbi:MAG TPA: 1,3-beta-glucanase, partial [Pseudonocardiaceae bacterium]|nr:1,3-beta-glucanase [Pseudonocardiaceae bacterium]
MWTSARRAALATGLLIVVATTISTPTTSAAPADVPAAPAGFTTTWSDDFNGAANSALDTGVWRYDTGTGFGTGEIETMTNSTSNVYEDGSG